MNTPAPELATQSAIAARNAWTLMQAFVKSENRRSTLRRELDMGPTKAEMLVNLVHGPMTLRDIARTVEIDPPSASIAVDQLERRDLVRRGPHPEDRRRKLVHLTEAGHGAAKVARRILTEPHPALAALATDDLTVLTRILGALTGKPGAPPPYSSDRYPW